MEGEAARAIEARFPILDSGGRGFGPHLYPIVKLLSAKSGKEDDWTWQHKGALRSAVTGRQWSQQRLHSAGLVDSKVCQLCVATLQCEPDTDDLAFSGTLLHRTCTCPALKEFRAQHMPSSVKTKLQSCTSPDGTIDPKQVVWFTRALRRSPLCFVPAREEHESFTWIKRPADGLLEGDVYTDGPLMDSESVLEGSCRALGWSFIILGLDGRVIAAARGCPPAHIDTIFGAELWAVQMVVTRALNGAVRVLTDCESVKTGCERGSRWTTSPDRVYARVWAVVHSTGDNGHLEVPVVWMPAHTAQWQVGESRKSDGTSLSDKDRDANDLADKGAKVAATGRRVADAIRGNIFDEAAEVADMARWIARVTVKANSFDIGDGTVIRDSQASQGAARSRLRGRKRKAGPVTSIGERQTERLLKAPRLEALRARILAKSVR